MLSLVIFKGLVDHEVFESLCGLSRREQLRVWLAGILVVEILRVEILQISFEFAYLELPFHEVLSAERLILHRLAGASLTIGLHLCSKLVEALQLRFSHEFGWFWQEATSRSICRVYFGVRNFFSVRSLTQ